MPARQVLCHLVVEHGGVAVDVEGELVEEHLVEDDCEGEDVGLAGEGAGLVEEYFGRAVGEGEAGLEAFLADLVVVGLAEVDEFDVEVVVGHDVVGFEVQVHDVEVAQVPKSLADRIHQTQLRVQTHPPAPILQKLAQTLAGDILHQQALAQVHVLGLDGVGGEVVPGEVDGLAGLHLVDDPGLVVPPAGVFLLGALLVEQQAIDHFHLEHHGLRQHLWLLLRVGRVLILEKGV